MNQGKLNYGSAGNGTLPHDSQMKSIELYGTKVVPMVKELLA